MSTPSARLPPHGVAIQRLPTLTEVIEPDFPLDAASAGIADSVVLREPVEAVMAEPLASPSTEAEWTDRILADVQRQVELMLEHRLREALMPALLQATDSLVLQARTELASTLREVVSRAVAQELSRHR